MWHEARRQEKKIRGLMVDFKRRADRRREFYEKIKQDPTQFLRMYGRPVKIHLDPAVAMAAEGPQSMMPWQGDSSNMIDRFDVRANLDIIPDFTGVKFEENPNYDEDEERWANYERYRTLVESEASGLTEEQCLHQIYLDEHFGTITKSNEEEKKKNADKKAAIGFVYEDSTPVEKKEDSAESEEESEDDLDTADLDVTIDVDTLTREQATEVNLCASQYGMKEDDFVRLLRRDKEELEAIKEARQLEEAKAQFSGRKSRRERRAINEKKHNPHRFNRPSYAARESPKYEPYKRPGSSSRSRSRSRSRSPEAVKVKFITSFGNESDEEGVVQGPVLPASVQLQPTAKTQNLESSKCETPWLVRRGSSQTKKDTSKPRRTLSRSRSRSRSRRRRRSSSRSSSSRSRRSRSRSRSRSGSRQRRYSPGYRRSSGRDRSRRSNRSNSRRHSSSSRSRSRSKSRSRSPAHSPKKRSRSKTPEPAPVIKRYRRESLSSNSGLSGIESDGEDNSNSNQSSFTNRDKNALDSSKLLTLSGGNISSKALTQKTRETPQERLKRRMQAQLNKQFKADKKAEITKISKQEQDRLDREEEIRNLALEMRRREREKRHREKEEEELKRPKSGSRSGSDSSRSNSGRSRSSSSEKSPDRRRRSRSQKSPDKRSDDRGRTSSDARSAERSNMDRSKDHRRDSDRKPEGRGNSDSVDRRRREDDDNWSNRREGRRWDSGNGNRDWRRDTQPSPRNERWDSDRRDRYPDRDRDRDMRDRDGRRNYRDRNDRDLDESRWRSRPGPPRPYLLPRPGSPQRSYRHPRN